MDEMRQIVENVFPAKSNSLSNEVSSSTEQSCTGTSTQTDKSTQTSRETYILMSVSQDSDGFTYATWKVLIDTENEYKMQLQTSKRDTSTQTKNENSLTNENFIIESCMREIFVSESEFSDLFGKLTEIDNKKKQTDNNNSKLKEEETNWNFDNNTHQNHFEWPRNNHNEDTNNMYSDTWLTHSNNSFSQRNNDREIPGFHDSETLIWSPTYFGTNQGSTPNYETPWTNFRSNEASSCCHTHSTYNSENFYCFEHNTSNVYRSELNNNDNEEDENIETIYEEDIHATQENPSDNASISRVPGHIKKSRKKITIPKKAMKKITLQEYRRRLEEKERALMVKEYKENSSKEDTILNNQNNTFNQ